MTVIYDNFDELEEPLKNPVLTIGNFDGVHRGHLALFDRVKQRSESIDGVAALITFEPHPLRVMKPGNGPPLITPLQQKLRLIAEAGIHIIFCIPFTKRFAKISAQDFVRNILVGKLGIREIVVGYDYSFGHAREGSIVLLQDMGETFGFKVHVVGPIHVNERLVSSTTVRDLIGAGNLREAKMLLGRDYQVCGTVIRGKNRGGRMLGFPTANLQLVDELIPKVGVYVVRVLIDDASYYGLTNIGYNPTFHDNQFSVETHILGFSGNLLGETIRVDFLERLRDEKLFESVEALANQIRSDIRQAKELLKKTNSTFI